MPSGETPGTILDHIHPQETFDLCRSAKYTHVCTPVDTHVYTHVCTHVDTNVYTHVCTHVCTHVHKYAYTKCTDVYTHVYTHVFAQSLCQCRGPQLYFRAGQR